MLKLKAALFLLTFLTECSFQILDEKGKEQLPGLQGEIAVQVKPRQPVGMFTRYVVRNLFLISFVFCFLI